VSVGGAGGLSPARDGFLMKLRIFSFPFIEDTGFDDTELQNFLSDREVVDVRDHFFVRDGEPWLFLVLSYRDMSSYEKDNAKRNHKKDPRTGLDEHERAVYDALRTWRTARAKQDGVPVYLVANNRQLAAMVKLRAETKADLMTVDGFGEEKVKHYGDEILEVLKVYSAGKPMNKEETKEAKVET